MADICEILDGSNMVQIWLLLDWSDSLAGFAKKARESFRGFVKRVFLGLFLRN